MKFVYHDAEPDGDLIKLTAYANGRPLTQNEIPTMIGGFPLDQLRSWHLVRATKSVILVTDTVEVYIDLAAYSTQEALAKLLQADDYLTAFFKRQAAS
jgi:hypothetical protein